MIDRIESATGPDRELDAEIARADGIALEMVATVSGQKGWFVVSKSGELSPILAYTASIDTALSLMPEGWYLQMLCHHRRCNEWLAEVWIDGPDGLPRLNRAMSIAPTAPLAILSAIMKARGLYRQAVRARLLGDK